MRHLLSIIKNLVKQISLTTINRCPLKGLSVGVGFGKVAAKTDFTKLFRTKRKGDHGKIILLPVFKNANLIKIIEK